MSSKVTYRQQYTRCGKERCRKCKAGTGHGPYWYAYWSENGRTISKYIGLRLPAHVVIERQLVGDAEKNDEATLVERQDAGIDDTANEFGLLPGVPLQLPTQVLRIYVLGQFRVDRLHGNAWSPVVNRTWHRRRARALLGCLLSNPGRRLGREQVMEALWPNLDLETAANRLNGAVHELRQILEPELTRPAASHMLHLERDVLELADRTSIWVDADTFENLLKEANTIGNTDSAPYLSLSASEAEQIEQLLEEASVLYVGDYLLEELYSEWAAPRREALRRGWIGLLLKLSELREARGDLAGAMDPLNRLLATDPTDETAVQRLMLLLTRLDRRGEALNTYRRLTSRLQQNYASEPLPETQELYEKLRHGYISKVIHPKIIISNTEQAKSALHLDADAAEEVIEQTPAAPPSATALTQSQHINADRIISHAISPFAGTSQLGRYNQSPLVGRLRELEIMHQVLDSIEGTAFRSQTVHIGHEQNARDAYPSDLELSIPQSMDTSVTPLQADVHVPHVLLLMGEAGIGKTRLAEELSHEATIRGWAIAWTRSYEQEGAIPYRPWIELLRMLLKNIPAEVLVSSVAARLKEKTPAPMQFVFGQGEMTPPTLLERLSTLLPELRDLLPLVDRQGETKNARVYFQLPPEQERLHLWEATLGLLSALSKTKPLLLVLDDLHWTEGSSRELLAYLTRHIQDQRILLLCTCRDVELAPNHSLRTLIVDLRREQAMVSLALQPLTPSQIGSLVAHLPPHIVQTIQTQAAGNPFFAEELAHVSEAMFAQPAEYRNSEIPSYTLARNNERGYGIALPGSPLLPLTTLPENIATILERRLGRLSNECQLLLGKAAVLGGSFEFSQLLFMANDLNEDSILDLLEEALGAGLLTEEGSGAHITYHFWHPLIVSHLYKRLSAARCAQLHRRAANTLLHAHQGHEGEVAATITHHLSKGGGDSAQISHFAELAGTHAYSLSAYAEAEQYYLLAIQTITHGELPLKEEVSGGGESALHKSVASLTEISDPLFVARLLERVCECRIVQGNFEEARNDYQCVLELRNQYQAITSLQEETERKQEAQIQALIWQEIGRTWASNGDYDQAYECYKRGKQVLQDACVTIGAAWACIHLQHGSIRNLQGGYDDARRYVLEALEMLEQAIQQNVDTYPPDRVPTRDVVAPLVGARSDPLVSARSDPPAGARSTSLVGARQDCFQTRTERASIGDPLDVGRAYELLGIIAVSVGQFTEALQHLHRALAIFEQHDLVIGMVKVCSNLGAVHAVKAENAVAQTYMYRSLELAERISNYPIIALSTGNLGEVAARTGNLLKAEEWFRRSLAISERTNEREHQCWCNIALAIALQDQGNLSGAAECKRRALAIARSMKSSRNIGGALIALADLRVVKTIIACKLQGSAGKTYPLSATCTRFLLRAKSTVQRAIGVEGLETELVVEGKVILASIHFLLGDLETARQEAIQTMEQSRQHELTRMMARSQRLLGRVLAAQGEYEQADVYFEEALQVFRDYEMRLDYARALHSYGETLLERDRPGSCIYKKGTILLQEARTIFAACHAAIDLDWVDQALVSAWSEIVET